MQLLKRKKLKIDYKHISGQTRENSSLIEPFQVRFVNGNVSKIPAFIETYHLTLATLPLGLLLLLVGHLAHKNLTYLLLAPVIIFLQYLADIFDGSLGRYRNTGLIKWGFYMDHICDFVFFSCLLLSLYIIYPRDLGLLLIVMFVVFANYVHEMLSCIAFGKYNTSGYDGVGGTELRIITSVLLTLIVIVKPVSLDIAYSVVSAVASLSLFKNIYTTQKKLWREDMRIKKLSQTKPE